MQTILVKYSEIGLKGKNRRFFEERLVENIAAMAGVERSAIKREYGRIRINPKSEDEQRAVEQHLPYVFGVHSFGKTLVAENTEADITEKALEAVKSAGISGGSFAIDTRRALKSFKLTSREISERVGRAIQDEYPGLDVDLGNPDLTVFIEVREKGAYIYTNRDSVSGPGGLPVGVSGSGLALMSGGIDSPVAAWLMLKRGLSMDAVYFHSAPHTSEKAKEKVFDLARVLARWKGKPMTVYVPSLTAVQDEISRKAPEPYWTVLFRRSMSRIAEAICDLEQSRRAGAQKYQLLVTGDSMAQVASQTPENLAVVNAAATALTLRPLIGFDKQETMNKARQIGTYDISVQPYEDCCSVFTPAAPKTKARLADVEKTESQCDVSELEAQAVEEMKVYRVTPTEVKEVSFLS